MASYLIAGLAIAVLFLIFIVQNTTPVVIHFLIWNLEGSLALILFLTLIVGIIMSLIVAIPLVLRRKKKSAVETTPQK